MLGIPYTLNEIATLISAKDLFQGNLHQILLRQVAFDSRMIVSGDETLFVALKTPNRNGHDFVAQAYQKGVRNFMVEQDLKLEGVNYILVDNCLEALQYWAYLHRQRFDYPVVALTGSNGKTTVKEWLTTLLESQFQLVKSPMSYNSQLGVALSLLQLHPQAQLALIEAGISQAGEMQALQAMIQPDLGILTHMGTAHAEGFSSFEEKIKEKLRLFEGGRLLIHSGEQPLVNELVSECLPQTETFTFGDFREKYGKEVFKDLRHLPVLQTQADRENASLAVLAALRLGMPLDEIRGRLKLLYPIQMRTEMITDNPEITLINDSYNSDLDSVTNAFERLQQNLSHKTKKVILSDILHQGAQSKQIHRQVLKMAITKFGAEHIYLIGEQFGTLAEEFPEVRQFADTQAFIKKFNYQDFRNATVLLKGARSFELERLIPFFTHNRNATVFHINLSALVHNLRYFKSLVPKHTQMMCMVKAFSYGSGTWEIAETLEKEGVDYMAVAYTSEAIELREKGIRTPVMVMNPDAESMEAMINWGVEPEIYDFDLLERYIRLARLAGLQQYPLHVKFDTGMGRLGFTENDVDRLALFLHQYPDIQLISVLTHLASADSEADDEFTHTQVQTFLRMYDKLHAQTGLSPLRHVLNSAGILRFPQYALEMVRLGIGLYGSNPLDNQTSPLQEIGSLVTTISQIHEYPAGTSIGYGRAQFTTRDSRIATLPIGYADGIFRALGNGNTAFWIRGKKAPTFGRVCMDMLMIDVTDLPEAQKGDEVLIFGSLGEDFQPVSAVAHAAGTIAYELLTRISPRVRRVYGKE